MSDVLEDQLNQQDKVADLSEPDDGRQWFIIQCYSGQEYKVQMRIQALIEDNKLTAKVFQVIIPEEEVIEIKNNQRVEKNG